MDQLSVVLAAVVLTRLHSGALGAGDQLVLAFFSVSLVGGAALVSAISRGRRRGNDGF